MTKAIGHVHVIILNSLHYTLSINGNFGGAVGFQTLLVSTGPFRSITAGESLLGRVSI